MIRFGDTGHVVRYIQIFLKENYNSNLFVSGVYDEDTHNCLIEYLKQPNVEKTKKFKIALENEFTHYNKYGNPDGGLVKLFSCEILHKSLRYTSRYINSDLVKFMNENIDYMAEYAKKYGWTLEGFTDPNSLGLESVEIMFKAEDRVDYFPNKDMLYMINLFSGQYKYGIAIRDGKGYDNQIHKSDGYKIAIIPCNPGDEFTIAHGYTQPCELVVGSCEERIDQIQVDISQVSNVIDMRDNNGGSGKLGAGGSILYTASNTASCIVIQMPYNKEANFANNSRIIIQIGDVNMDGIIDNKDLELLNKYVNGELGYELEGPQLIAANCCIDFDPLGNPIIDDRDVRYLREYLDGERVSLGTSYYETPYDTNNNEIDKLLVVSGHVGPSSRDLAYLNVPVSKFYENPWIVHEKFAGYIMRLNITPYSDSDSIGYAQRIMEYVMLYGANPIRRDIIYNTLYPGKVTAVAEPVSDDSSITKNVYYLNTSTGTPKLDDLPMVIYTPRTIGYFDTDEDYNYYQDRDPIDDTDISLKDLISCYQRTMSAVRQSNKGNPLTFTFGYLDIETDALMQTDLIGINVDLYERRKEAKLYGIGV